MSRSTLTIDLRQVSLVGEDVTFHDDWSDAIEHVAAVTRTERDFLWFRPGTSGLLVFEDSEAATDRVLAAILNPHEYQAAKSRGDLEDLAFSPAHIVLRGTPNFAGPGSDPRPGILPEKTMTKPQNEPAAKPQTETAFLILADSMVWHSKKCLKGSILTLPSKLSKDDVRKRDLWLQKQWMREASEEERNAPPSANIPAPANPPPTLEQTAESADGTFVLLDPRTIAPSPVNPRRHFDDATMEELTASVQARGVRVAINVRPMPAGAWIVQECDGLDKFLLHDTRRGITVFPREIMETAFATRQEAEAALPKYEIIAGERRWRASRLAGRETIRAIVEHLDDVEAAELQVVENAQREDLSDLEEAAGYKHLLSLPGYSMERLVKHVGKARNTIYGRLKLLDLPEVALKSMEQGKLPAATAEVIARLPEDLREKATKQIVEHRSYGHDERQALPVREAKRVADELLEQRRKAELRKQAVAEAKSKGMVPLDEQESSNTVGGYGGEISSTCGYVGATQKCPRDPNGRTWKQVLKDQPGVQVYAAIRWVYDDKAFKTVAVYKREETSPVLKRLGLWNAEGSKASDEKEKKRREKEAAGRKHEAMQVAIDELKDRAELDGPQFAMNLLRPLVEALIEANPVAAFFVAKRRAMVSATENTYRGRDAARKALRKVLGAGAAKHDCGLAAELAVASLSGNYAESEYYRQGIQRVADALGIINPEFQGANSADVRTEEVAA